MNNTQPVSRVVLIVGSDMTSGIVAAKARTLANTLAGEPVGLDLRALAIAGLAGLIVCPETGRILGVGEEWTKHLSPIPR
ncbi:MAG: hypothetical protein KBG20_22910 [Caldilineaceae bacterium]|nr:hypothetical protein [Caldilineaceae bacterium]MBP9075177.1 hypothetical protein [Caldilineaceae bacterium]